MCAVRTRDAGRYYYYTRGCMFIWLISGIHTLDEKGSKERILVVENGDIVQIEAAQAEWNDEEAQLLIGLCHGQVMARSHDV